MQASICHYKSDLKRHLRTKKPWSQAREPHQKARHPSNSGQERDSDYFGPTVNRTARLMGLAHGGQTVVSLAVEELVRDSLPDGARLVSLGEHQLRGLSRAETVFQITIDGLDATFPVLRSSAEAHGNLPVPPTSFVGRADELERLTATLTDPGTRLVTLTGVGGVGKTRLAIEAAWAITDEHPDGSWLIELAPVTEPDSVTAAVADALDVRPQQNMTMTDAIVDRLGTDRALVVIDNCEHVLPPVSELIDRMVRNCPEVVVVATSREPVGVDGERVWPVRSLDAVLEGVDLFCDRALAADPDFTLGDTRHVVEALCERLDGIPLAIELAAARVRALTPAALAERLDERFRLLRAGRRGGGLERHRTLRATVDWSYQLLDDDERLLFDRLCVFAGSFDLPAVEAVCADGEVIDDVDVLDLLASLVDKSLVTPAHSGANNRYRLLETLRQYGEEQLDTRGELADLRDRHLAYYVELAETAQQQFEGTENQRGRLTFDTEWSNLRTAFDWALATNDIAAADGLLAASRNYADTALRRELGDWADRLRLVEPTIIATGVAATWVLWDGDLDRAIQLGEAGLERASSPTSGDTFSCWRAVSSAYMFSGRFDEGRQALDATFRVEPSTTFDAAMLTTMQMMAAAWFDPARAADRRDAARRLIEPLANPTLDCYLEYFTGRVEYEAGHYQEAAEIQAHALALSDEAQNRWTAGVGASALAMSAAGAGSPRVELWSDALGRLLADRHWMYVWTVVEALALHWLRSQRRAASGVVYGYLEAQGLRYPTLSSERDSALADLASDGEESGAMRRGAAMDRDEIIEFVLAQLDADRSTTSAGLGPPVDGPGRDAVVDPDDE